MHRWTACAALLLAAPSALASIEQQNTPKSEEPEPPPPAPVLTKAPELVEFFNAAYPPQLLYRGVEGEVLMLIDIDPFGEVERVQIQNASDPAFISPAMVAATRFLFSPAEIDGEPAGIRIEYRYVFTAVEMKPDAIAGQPTRATEEALRVNFAGTVREAGTRGVVASAVIKIDGRAVAETDKEGNFEVRGAPTGSEFEVVVTSPYHDSYRGEEELLGGEKLEATYYVLRTSYDPFETVVRAKAKRREASKVQLERRELARVPGTGGDPLRVLENLPGMGRVQGGLGGALLVRGANPTDTAVFIDGVEIPLIYHFGGLTSVVHASMLDRIDFYPGGFSARYGGAIAGIVNVVTRDLDCDDWHGAADISLIDAEANTCVPLGENWKVTVAGRRSYLDALLPLVLQAALTDDDQGFLTLAPIYADYQLKAQARYGKHDLSFFFFGSDDQFRVIQVGSAESINFDFGFHQAFHRFLFRHKFRIADGLTLTTSVSPGYEITEFVGGSEELNLRTEARGEQWTVAVREEVRWKPFDTFELRGGFDGKFGSNEVYFDFPVPNTIRAHPTPTFDFTVTAQTEFSHGLYNHAYWVEADWEPGFGIQIVPGLRIERWDFNKTQDLSVMPRVNARWEIAEGMTAKAAWGIFEKLPDDQLILPKPLGNPALRPLQSQHFILGYEHAFTDLINLDVTLFYNLRDRIPASSNNVRFIDGETRPQVWAGTGAGETYGVEILLRHMATEVTSGGDGSVLDVFRGRFFGWIAYTLSQSVRWDRDPGAQYFVQQGANTILTQPYSERSASSYLSDFDQTHILTIVGSVRLPFEFELGMRFRLVSGNPFTPSDTGDTYVNIDSDTYGIDNTDVPRNSERFPLFHQLDIRLDKTWTFDLWSLTAYLEILNAYNQANVEQYQYDYRYRERTPLTVLPLVPIIGVSGQW